MPDEDKKFVQWLFSFVFSNLMSTFEDDLLPICQLDKLSITKLLTIWFGQGLINMDIQYWSSHMLTLRTENVPVTMAACRVQSLFGRFISRILSRGSQVKPSIYKSVCQPFDSQEWSVCKCSLHFGYSVKQTGNENEETYQLRDMVLTEHQILRTSWERLGELTFRSWEWNRTSTVILRGWTELHMYTETKLLQSCIQSSSTSCVVFLDKTLSYYMAGSLSR